MGASSGVAGSQVSCLAGGSCLATLRTPFASSPPRRPSPYGKDTRHGFAVRVKPSLRAQGPKSQTGCNLRLLSVPANFS